MTRNILVLSGGGFAGAFQAGAILNLVTKHKLKFSIVTGTSVGALNGALFARTTSDANFDTDEISLGADHLQSAGILYNFWRQISSSREFFKTSWGFTKYLRVLFDRPIMSNEPLRKRLVDLGIEPRAYNPNRTVFRFNVTDMTSGKELIIGPDTNPEHFLDYLIGSTSIPVLHTMPSIHGRVIGDGSLRTTTPLNSAIDVIKANIKTGQWSRGDRYRIFVVLCHPRNMLELDKSTSQFKMMVRILEIMRNEITRNDISVAESISSQVMFSTTQGKRRPSGLIKDGNHIDLDIKVIEPTVGYGDIMEASRRQIHFYMDHGEEMAENMVI